MQTVLAHTQRRFFDALLEPLSGEARSVTELAPAAAEVSTAFRETADTLLRSTPAVSATERLGLYHRQYWYRLLDSIAEDFPRLQKLLGRDAFWALMERYLCARPPASFTLRHLGAGLADFIAEDEQLPATLRPWATDLARFEYAFMEVFEAAEAALPSDADLAARELKLSPAVRLLPVARPLSAWMRDEARPPAEFTPRRQLLVVWRDSGHRLRDAREPLSLLPLLRSLQTGGALGDILARCPLLPAPAVIEAAFARWRRRDWIALA